MTKRGLYRFEHFQLDPVARTLTRGGMAVPLSARLFDTLLTLVLHADRLVTRDELTQAVWPGRMVEDGNLGKAVSAVREALKGAGAGEDLVVTIARRGYRFAAVVTFEPAADLAAERAPAPAPDPSPSFIRSRAAALGVCVALAALAAAVAIARQHGPAPGPHPFTPPPHSVAVLPFSQSGLAPADDYFSDGLADEVVNALGRIEGVRVAARQSSFSFGDRHATIGEIGRALNVAMVLEGSVRRDGKRTRVSAQLIDAETGYQVWARNFDGDDGDEIAVQGRIAEAAIGSLKIALLGGDVARLNAGGTSSAAAFDKYLLALHFAEASGTDGHRTAMDLLDAAIAADPAYAMAYVQRARSRMYLAINDPPPDRDARARMVAASLRDAEHAAALAPDLGAAHAAVGYVLKCTLSDLARADAELTRAIALAPSDGPTLMSYAFFQSNLGHADAAVAAAAHAAALDPLTPQTRRMLAIVAAYAGRFDDAIAALDSARRLSPIDPVRDRIYLGIVQTLQGDARAARQTCEGEPDANNLACRAWADHALGHEAEAQAALAKLRMLRGDEAAYQYAQIYAKRGDTDDALHWLDIAYGMRDPGLIEIRADPMLNSVRGTVRYRDLLGRLGFPP